MSAAEFDNRHRRRGLIYRKVNSSALAEGVAARLPTPVTILNRGIDGLGSVRASACIRLIIIYHIPEGFVQRVADKWRL
jgi:hypothetical protein